LSHFYLSTYGPLAMSKVGRGAAIRYSLPPFIDGSIRREPDLEHEYPAITCLRRTNKFAPRLEVDDVVAFMLKKGSYGMGYRHQRVTAVLRVIAVKQSHVEGAEWYRQRRRRLPNNCMVPGTKAFPLSKSHQVIPKRATSRGKDSCSQWDTGNKQRAKRWGTFVICQRLFINLDWDAPEVSKEMLMATFTRRSMKTGQKFLKQLGLGLKI
jgi:hypothetical protein